MAWKVTLSDIDLGEEEVAAVTRVLRSKWLSMGEVTREFEQRFAEYLGVKHAFAVANGTAALHMANLALGIGTGDEVIVPALTFVATANAVLYCGAKPVFSDVASLDDLNLSPADIESKITPRTRAICVMHYGGYCVDMTAIAAIAQKHNLRVVEDAAHAPGAEHRGRKAGTLGDIGCFSFFANKNLVTGEGGMVVTDDDALAERLASLRSHGMTTLTWDRHRGHAHSYDVVTLGHNYRTTEMSAALGLAQLQKLEPNNRKRARIVKVYQEHLASAAGLTIPFAQYEGKPAYHLFPIILPAGVDRTEFMTRLRAAGIQTSIHYPPIHLFSYYRERFGYSEGMLPMTESAGKRQVTLPLHSEMVLGDAQFVAEQVKNELLRVDG